jgi:hypothetical protein
MATTEIEGIGVCILLSIHPTACQDKAIPFFSKFLLTVVAIISITRITMTIYSYNAKRRRRHRNHRITGNAMRSTTIPGLPISS